LVFKDEAVATETLSALKAKSSIISACLYDAEGKALAKFTNESGSGSCPEPPKEDSNEFNTSSQILFKSIFMDNQKIGTVYIQRELGELYTRLKAQLISVTIVVFISSIIAYLLSSIFQRVISEPIVALANIARTISDRPDYSIRAKPQSNDELGL
jgi:hypothetical protein